MPVAAPLKKITSWSYSRYALYRKCPAQFKYKHIDKIGGPTTSPAMERGTAIHAEFEQYLRGHGRSPPKSLGDFGKHAKVIRDAAKKAPSNVVIEETWALTSSWTWTRWDDWRGCWVRIKLDAAHVDDSGDKPVATITDLKTGKYRPFDVLEYELQLDLYALGALLKWENLIPEGLSVKPRLAYVDEGVVHETKIYTGADLPPLKKAWEARVKPMMNDTTFKPTPSDFACRYCDFSKAKGGACRY